MRAMKLCESYYGKDYVVNLIEDGIDPITFKEYPKDIEWLVKTREKINRIISETTGQPLEKVEQDTDRDHYLTAQEALEYGLIDGIMDKRA
jgi:ATP-dependent protease ClpP protease subunit